MIMNEDQQFQEGKGRLSFKHVMIKMSNRHISALLKIQMDI